MRLDFKKNEKLIRIASIILIGILVLFMFKTPVTDKGTSKASGDSGNLDEHVLQLSEAVERLCNAVPVSLGTIHRLFRKRMDLFDCFL